MAYEYGGLNKEEVLLVSWQRALLGGHSQVYLLNETGLRQITRNTGFDYCAGYWGADPQTCFVTTQYGNKGHLYLYRTDGSWVRELAANGRAKLSLHLSPGGRYLAFWEHPPEDGGGLVILDWKNDHRTVVQDENRLVDVWWAGDSQSLAAISWGAGQLSVWYRYGLDGRELERRPLPHLLGMRELMLSPDWGHVAYAHLDDAYESHLMVAGLDGSETHRLGLLNDMESPPVWSPDGKLLAWVGMMDGDDRDGPFWLFVADANGSNVRRLMALDEVDDSGEIYPGHPAWSSDSLKLAISSFVENPESTIEAGADAGSAVFVVDVGSGAVRQVSDAAGVMFRVEWRP